MIINDRTYTGTIRALSGGPLGACQGKASSCGCHPYTCEACQALCMESPQVLAKNCFEAKN